MDCIYFKTTPTISSSTRAGTAFVSCYEAETERFLCWRSVKERARDQHSSWRRCCSLLLHSKLNSGKIIVLNISQVLQKSTQGSHDSKTEPWITLYYRKPKCPHQPQNKESTRLSCYHVLFQRKQWHVCCVSELQMNTHSEPQQGCVRTAGNLGWVCSEYRGCGVRSEGVFTVWAQENSKQNFAGVKDDIKWSILNE